jgi:hypothetical protein
MRLLLLLLFLFSFHAWASEPKLPDGWRSPSEAELNDAWRDNCLNRCAWIAGDFNGDSLVEGAFLAVNEKQKVFGLLAFIYVAPNKIRWFILDKNSHPSWISAMGVQLRTTGSYRVLCSNSEKSCSVDGKVPLQIENQSISYFKSESAESLFLWHEKKKRFIRFWESD